jgi:hypothetical protein
VRLTALSVQDYKALDRVELQLPPPSTPDQTDTFVLGSRNGVGKTSILEGCALGLLGALGPELFSQGRRFIDQPGPYGMLVRAGTRLARVHATVNAGGTDHVVAVEITEAGIEPTIGAGLLHEMSDRSWLPYGASEDSDIMEVVLGRTSEPLLFPPLLTFHSYRKVLEGASALGAMVDGAYARSRYPRRYREPLSTFKVALIQALMARSGLFEGISVKEANQDVLDKLNGLLGDFAGGKVDKLKPGPDGTLELRVAPTSGGPSFSFDGLSSGQKEIIATLFLIWFTTRRLPSVVLIDEPELHLNAEWQRIFVHQLAKLAPNNQYILATHSEEIFSSVPEDRRLMLERE